MNITKKLWRKRRFNESYFRYIIGLIHLWIGLFSGIVIILLSLTGALYVFTQEYDDIENRKLATAETNFESIPSLDKAVEQYRTDFGQDPGQIFIPADTKKNISIANRGLQDDRIKVYVNRSSGEFTGKASNKSKIFSFKIISLHRWFMLNDMALGRKIAGFSTLVFIFLLISGLVVWFPRNLKAAKNSFKVKLKGSYKAINRQLHVNLGFYMMLLLLIVALSGVCITFMPVRQAIVKVFVPKEAQKKEKRMNKKEHQEVRSKYATADFSFDKILRTAEGVLGYESDRNIYFPTHHFKEYSVLAVNPDNFWGGTWADVVTFDMNGNYKTTYFFEDMPLHQQLNQLIKPIHTGEIFGTKSKLFYLFLSLFACFLPISGFIIWWKKIIKKG